MHFFGVWEYNYAYYYGNQWTWAYTGILEAYGITNCTTDWPVSSPWYFFWNTELYANPGYTFNSNGGGFSGTQYAYDNAGYLNPYEGPNCGWQWDYENLGTGYGYGWALHF